MTKIFLIIFIASAGDVQPIVEGGYLSATACVEQSKQVIKDLTAQGIPLKDITGGCINSGLAVAPKVGA